MRLSVASALLASRVFKTDAETAPRHHPRRQSTRKLPVSAYGTDSSALQPRSSKTTATITSSRSSSNLILAASHSYRNDRDRHEEVGEADRRRRAMQQRKECDPRSSSFNGGRDGMLENVDGPKFSAVAHDSGSDFIGILSCGLGQYCRESSESSLGGFCVDHVNNDATNPNESSATTTTSRRSHTGNPFPKQLVRQRHRRGQVVGRLSVIQLADLFCNKPNQTGLTVDCDCTGMDFQDNTGTFSCNFGPDCVELETGCEPTDSGTGGLAASNGGTLDFARDVDKFEHCTSELFTANITTESLYEYTSCYTQTMPRTNYTFTYCTDFAFNVVDGPTCNIDIGGVRCNSCEIAIGAGYTYGENCEVFDCTNTFLNYSGDRCEQFSNPALRSASITEYLYDSFWPCLKGGCNLCGDGGRMTTGFENFTYTTQFLNVTDTFYCYDVNYQALTGGLYGTSYCQSLTNVVRDVCGCSGGDLPNPSPSYPTSTTPGSQPGTGPSAAPPDESLSSSSIQTLISLKKLGRDWGTTATISAIGSFVIWSVLSTTI